MDPRLSEKLQLAIGLLVFLAFFYFVFQNAGFVRELATGYGLLGVFLASLIANATVLLPLPVDLAVIAINAQSDSLGAVLALCLAVGIGAGLGEMSAYIAGLLGIETAERIRAKEFSQIRGIREKIERRGMAFIFMMALIPFPFDIIGITAGFIKYNPKKFFVAALIGKTCRYLALGLIAYYGFAAFKGFSF